jgi:hypothetical protein
MSYPKPLSEKTIERLYREAGISNEMQTYLHTLFAACANLYGFTVQRQRICIYLKSQQAPLTAFVLPA